MIFKSKTSTKAGGDRSFFQCYAADAIKALGGDLLGNLRSEDASAKAGDLKYFSPLFVSNKRKRIANHI